MLDAACEVGLEVPRDLSVVGFDNVPESVLSRPALTTVAQPIQEMGYQALTMLLALPGREVEEHVVLPTELVLRGSTAPPRVHPTAASSTVASRSSSRRTSGRKPQSTA